MALSEFEIRKYEKLVSDFIEKRRPPMHVRKELDLGFRVKGQSVEIFEIRPMWRQPDKIIEEAAAKATYVKTKKVWKVYWQRADLKWRRYDPDPEVYSLEEFLNIVDRDECACFFGWRCMIESFQPARQAAQSGMSMMASDMRDHCDLSKS